MENTALPPERFIQKDESLAYFPLVNPDSMFFPAAGQYFQDADRRIIIETGVFNQKPEYFRIGKPLLKQLLSQFKVLPVHDESLLSYV
jgi:hypothetical protein